MSVSLEEMKAHLNVTLSVDDLLISDQIVAAEAHLASWLGFALDDDEEFPDGTPADVDHAVKMLVAHWYANRETAFISNSAAAMEIPFAVAEIVRNYRKWTF